MDNFTNHITPEPTEKKGTVFPLLAMLGGLFIFFLGLPVGLFLSLGAGLLLGLVGGVLISFGFTVYVVSGVEIKDHRS